MKEYHFTYVYKNRKITEFVHAQNEVAARNHIYKITAHLSSVQHIKLVGVTK